MRLLPDQLHRSALSVDAGCCCDQESQSSWLTKDAKPGLRTASLICHWLSCGFDSAPPDPQSDNATWVRITGTVTPFQYSPSRYARSHNNEEGRQRDNEIDEVGERSEVKGT